MNATIIKVRIEGFIEVYDPDHDCVIAESVGSFIAELDSIDQSVIDMLGGVQLPNAEFYDYKQIGVSEEF